MRVLLAATASLAGIFAVGWIVKWIFEEYPNYGFGLVSGMAVMAGLWFLAEKLGYTQPRY